MTTEAQRVIEGAYKILSSEERWTRGVCARDDYGRCVEVESKSASCFCVEGALKKSAASVGVRFWPVLSVVNEASGERWASKFNDRETTTHTDILRVLREAHKLAGNGEPEVTP